METHKVARLSLSCLYQLTLSASFEGLLNFEILSFRFSWVNVPSLFISFNIFFFTSILLNSVCPWSVCLLISECFVMFIAYVFIINMVAKIFCPDKQIDWFPGPCVWKAAIEIGQIVIADLLPWSDFKKCMYTTLF